MYSHVLTKFLFGSIFMYLIAFYGTIVYYNNSLPYIIASQWYSLASIIVLILSVFAFVITITNIAIIFESKETEDLKIVIYELFDVNVISPIWQCIFFIGTVIMFQLGNYINTFISFTIFLCLCTFRIAHKRIIRKVEVQVLNDSISKK